MVQVIIRHPRTDEAYEVAVADFRRGKHYRKPGGEMVTYEDAGFRIESKADGSPYDEPDHSPRGVERPEAPKADRD